MTGKHAADLPVHVRRCQDNKAYLWYFDKPTEIGFEWTGDNYDPIEVTQGGFGEPVSNIFYTTPTGVGLREVFSGHGQSPIGVVTAFEMVCKAWVATITADLYPSEPQMVVSHG